MNSDIPTNCVLDALTFAFALIDAKDPDPIVQWLKISSHQKIFNVVKFKLVVTYLSFSKIVCCANVKLRVYFKNMHHLANKNDCCQCIATNEHCH